MKTLLINLEKITDLDYNKLFASTSTIKNDFYKIWNMIIQKTQLNISVDTAMKEFENLTIYEAVDGSRSTLNQNLNRGEECVLYVINFIHTLKALGAKTCLIMIHTSYNRNRGENEIKNILHNIEIGSALIKKYGIQNNICCSCICINEDYELIDLLKDVTESTKNGEFCTYFLFDYNEKWAMTERGQNIIKNLPNIDVHIRHTKFQFSGGWIPDKMSHSAFLYSQNGSIYSNWDSDELVTLLALSLLAKLLHKGEILNKTYITRNEINKRYRLRELELFNKVIELRSNPKKLFMIGSPNGVYQFYY